MPSGGAGAGFEDYERWTGKPLNRETGHTSEIQQSPHVTEPNSQCLQTVELLHNTCKINAYQDYRNIKGGGLKK